MDIPWEGCSFGVHWAMSQMNPLKLWKFFCCDSHYNIEPLQQKLFLKNVVGKGLEG
jgi:hypothetical protein